MIENLDLGKEKLYISTKTYLIDNSTTIILIFD